MISYYVKVACRSLRKHPFYSIINLIGLSIGISCFLAISLYVSHELSFDSFHEEGDRIYRLTQSRNFEIEQHLAVTPGPAAAMLKQELPEIENASRFVFVQRTLRNDESILFDQQIVAADPEFFDLFSFALTQGNSQTALSAPFSIVLTESLAFALFGDKNPINHALTVYHGSYPELYTITGVVADAPYNSHIQFDALTSLSTEQYQKPMLFGDWKVASMFFTYVRLDPQADPVAVEQKITEVAQKYTNENEMPTIAYHLQPMLDIHLHSQLTGEFSDTNNVSLLYILIGVAGLILLISCINYINLTLARSSRRVREMGVHKVIGAHRSSLALYFLVEAALFTGFAIFMALLFLMMAMPFISLLTGAAVTLNQLAHPTAIALLIAIGLPVAMLSGGYPAFILSKVHVVEALKGQLSENGHRHRYRKSLLAIQFTVMVVLIASVFSIHKQMKFLLERDLGFNSGNLIAIHVPGGGRFTSRLIQPFSDIPGVVDVTANSRKPGFWARQSLTRNLNNPNQHVVVNYFDIAPDYVEKMGMNLLAGHDFRRTDTSGDQPSIIINESALRALGWSNPEEALHQLLYVNAFNPALQIIGVLKDFHYESLHKHIEPLVLYGRSTEMMKVLVRYEAQHLGGVLEGLEQAWKQQFPGRPFQYSLISNDLANSYTKDQHLGYQIGFFALLAVLLSAVGLFGLAALTTIQRTKEIGIRKVLGASTLKIMHLLTSEYLKLFGFAFLLSIPIGFITMRIWLERFAYQTDIGVLEFVFAGVVAVGTILVTVLSQSVRIALSNPGKSLHYE